jgi:hypothetical protein
MSAYARVLLVLTAFAVAVLVSMNAVLGVTAGLAAVIGGVLLDRYTAFCTDDEDAPPRDLD